MGRDTVASLSLRGAFAGARLRARFAPTSGGMAPDWARHRWLRLRVAVRALEQQRERTTGVVPAYLGLLDPGAAAAAASAPSPVQAKPLYLPGDPEFCDDAAAALRRLGSTEPVAGAKVDVPRPAPTLILAPPT